MFLPSLNAALTLDPKGRVMLPRALRDALDLQGVSKLVAFANGGPKGGLALYRIEDFQSMQKSHQQGDSMDPRSRLFALAIASTAHTVNIDNAGRMLIPPPLRSLLDLERELTLFTAGAWIEIWDRSRWEAEAYPKAADLWDQLYGFGSLQPPASPAPAPPETPA